MSGPVKDPLRALQGARSRAQGGRLEEQIEASCALLTETGRADISKTPEPMKPVSQPNKSGQFRAVYTKKAEPDFKGVMLGGRAVMFEAKSTGTGRLNKDRVLPEQVKKLDSYTALGAHCFIVATFDGLRVYRIPWTVWRSMKQRYGRNYVTEADIKEYAVRFGPGFTPDLLRGIPTMYDINPLSNVSDLLRMHPSRGPRKGSRGHPQRSAGADCDHHQQALRLRRTEMARNSVCKTAILFVFGGLAYFGLEVLFRGHSHWTMFVLGGFLFLILGELNEGLLEWDTPLIWQGVLGSAIVTGAELVTGMILNVWLGLGVWDYSGMPFNYKGQICLPFSILWIFVSIAAVVLDDWLRYWLFGEEHPHYTLFRRGESR